MRNSITLTLLLIAIISSCQSPDGKHEYDPVLKELDEAIADEAKYFQLKDARTSGLRIEYEEEDDPVSRYAICKALYNEYSRYDCDSSLAYAHRKEQIAREIGDKNLIADAAIDLADRYVVSGMFAAALDIFEKTDTSQVPQGLKSAYATTLRKAYHGLATSDKDAEHAQEYVKKERQHIFDSRNLIQNNEIEKISLEASRETDNGHPEIGRQLLINALESGNVNDREKASLHYDIAKTYRAEGNIDKQILHFAISANLDKRTPVKASRSLINLARLLYEQGDTDKAFKYIMVAYDDATKADAFIALSEINRFLPEVIESYEEIKSVRNRLLQTILYISLLFVLSLSILLVIVYRDRLKIHRMQKKIQQNYEEIKSINANLVKHIVQLDESNHIKDTYMGRYLSMFSEHIDSMERYRSMLRVTAKSQSMDEMHKALRSDTFIDNERSTLYNEFDTTFLGIFPNFVSQLNELLKEDSRIGQNLVPGKLSNEIRIFALMRLGVNDSYAIARFLRKSPSTIFNYKVKLRNASIYDREEFDKRLMNLGKPTAPLDPVSA